MPDLRELLHGAVDRPDPLDLDGLGRRVRRQQRQRRIALASVIVMVVLAGGVAVALATRQGGGADVDLAPVHQPPGTTQDPGPIARPTTSAPGSSASTGSTTTPSSTTSTTRSTSTTTATGTSAVSSVTVPGGPGGAPPCAAKGSEGQYGESPSHPERAPLQTQATFAGGVRWAVCGAGISQAEELLNLRSGDGGQTWSVTDTGLSGTVFHAGDQVDVQLTSATVGKIHVVSLVGERDDRYSTNDGGLHWRPVR
jgi:hypothetical protein